MTVERGEDIIIVRWRRKIIISLRGWIRCVKKSQFELVHIYKEKVNKYIS